MSSNKNNKTVTEEVPKATEGTPDAKEVIQTLKVQYQEHQRQAEHHQTMAVKAQGALEVLLQLHPEKAEGEES